MKLGYLYIFKEKEFLPNASFMEQYVFFGNPIEKPDIKIISYSQYSKYDSINGFKVDINKKIIRIGLCSYDKIFLKIPDNLPEIDFNEFNRLIIRKELEENDKKIIFGDLEKSLIKNRI